MTLDTIMSTAASYMEDFALYEFAGAVEDYENRPKGMIKAALERAIAYGESLIARQGPIDEVNDLIRACEEAYNAYIGSVNESKKSKNSKKNTVKLTESELKKVITESVKNVLKEGYEDADFSNEFGKIADALYIVRNMIGDYLLRCKHYPRAYSGMEERLNEISILIKKAISIAGGYDKALSTQVDF